VAQLEKQPVGSTSTKAINGEEASSREIGFPKKGRRTDRKQRRIW